MSYTEAKELADHFNIRFLEASAKEALNVEEAFAVMTKEIKGKVATKIVDKPTKITVKNHEYDRKKVLK